MLVTVQLGSGCIVGYASQGCKGGLILCCDALVQRVILNAYEMRGEMEVLDLRYYTWYFGESESESEF